MLIYCSTLSSQRRSRFSCAIQGVGQEDAVLKDLVYLKEEPGVRMKAATLLAQLRRMVWGIPYADDAGYASRIEIIRIAGEDDEHHRESCWSLWGGGEEHVGSPIRVVAKEPTNGARPPSPP